MQTMVNNELVKNGQLVHTGISADLKTITNLQAIKHGLKVDASDHQICDWLFSKLTFTEKLIAEHLGQSAK